MYSPGNIIRAIVLQNSRTLTICLSIVISAIIISNGLRESNDYPPYVVGNTNDGNSVTVNNDNDEYWEYTADQDVATMVVQLKSGEKRTFIGKNMAAKFFLVGKMLRVKYDDNKGNTHYFYTYEPVLWEEIEK